MHNVSDDLLITPFLLRRFVREAEIEQNDQRHYAVLLRRDGQYLDYNPGSPELEEMQAVFARDLLRMLNRELHHDGAWVIVFTDPAPPQALISLKWEYRRFAILWLDRDGDPHFSVEWLQGESDEFDFADVLLSGIESWVARAETAWQEWKMLMRDVIDPTSEQTFKRAQGQAPTNVVQ